MVTMAASIFSLPRYTLSVGFCFDTVTLRTHFATLNLIPALDFVA
jgi:hypothetical protein